MLPRFLIFANTSKRFLKMTDRKLVARADDINSYSKLNGRKNQSITKPISLDANTGEVLVRKSTGKTRVRKGQSDEEYNEQLYEYFQVQNGPRRREEGWANTVSVANLLDKNPDLNIKQERQKLTGMCHVLYYRKQYEECAIACGQLIPRYNDVNKNKKISKEIQELEYMIKRSKELMG